MDKILLKSKIINFIFPTKCTCNVCGKEIFNGGYFCDECEKELPFNDNIICKNCGRKTYNAVNYCQSCRGGISCFDMARSVFDYFGQIKTLIKLFKYNGKQYLAGIFAEYMANLYIKSFFNCDVIIFTPMTQQRMAERGYNQAKLLAHRLSPLISLPVDDELIIKTKETSRQATLNRDERHKNLHGSFKITDKSRVVGKRILIVDDVMTTGATCDVMSELLKKAGASYVGVLTIASVSLEH